MRHRNAVEIRPVVRAANTPIRCEIVSTPPSRVGPQSVTRKGAGSSGEGCFFRFDLVRVYFLAASLALTTFVKTLGVSVRRAGGCALPKVSGALGWGGCRMLLILALLLVLILFGAGFAVHLLWILAAIFLVIWVIGFAIGRGEGAGSHRFFRW